MKVRSGMIAFISDALRQGRVGSAENVFLGYI